MSPHVSALRTPRLKRSREKIDMEIVSADLFKPIGSLRGLKMVSLAPGIKI